MLRCLSALVLTALIVSCTYTHDENLGQWIVSGAGGRRVVDVEMGRLGLLRKDLHTERVGTRADGGYETAPFSLRVTIRNPGKSPIYIHDVALSPGGSRVVVFPDIDTFMIRIAAETPSHAEVLLEAIPVKPPVAASAAKFRWKILASYSDGP